MLRSRRGFDGLATKFDPSLRHYLKNGLHNLLELRTEFRTEIFVLFDAHSANAILKASITLINT